MFVYINQALLLLGIRYKCNFRESDLIEAMEKTVEFHDLLRELINWVGETENGVLKLDSGAVASSNDIRNEVII